MTSDRALCGYWGNGDAPCSLVLAGGALVQRVDAAEGQRRGVVRRGGCEDCVQEDQHENAQSESVAAAQSCG